MNANRILVGALALCTTGLAGFAAGTRSHQEFVVEPTEQHAWLASLAGEYTAELGGIMGESEGASRIESKLGGLWNVTHFEGTMMGAPIQGIEILGYDPLEETFVSVWVDSMSTSLMVTEGSYDPETKTLTMRGESRGMDGEVAQAINTTRYTDDGMTFEMAFEGQPGPAITIEYTRVD